MGRALHPAARPDRPDPPPPPSPSCGRSEVSLKSKETETSKLAADLQASQAREPGDDDLPLRECGEAGWELCGVMRSLGVQMSWVSCIGYLDQYMK